MIATWHEPRETASGPLAGVRVLDLTSVVMASVKRTPYQPNSPSPSCLQVFSSVSAEASRLSSIRSVGPATVMK